MTATASASGAPTHYDVLGLGPHAGRAEIRARFFKLIRVHHPDKTHIASDSVAQKPIVAPPQAAAGKATDVHGLLLAYQVLSDETQRRIYDEELARAKRIDEDWTTTKHFKPRISHVLDLDSFTPREVVVSGDGLNTASGAGKTTTSTTILFSHSCRCGSEYIVSADELVDDDDDDDDSNDTDDPTSQGQREHLVECQGCSEVAQIVWRDDDNDDESEGSNVDADDQG